MRWWALAGLTKVKCSTFKVMPMKNIAFACVLGVGVLCIGVTLACLMVA